MDETTPTNETDTCPKCHERLEIGSWPFCNGGHGKGTNNVVDDTIIGGEVMENVGHEPITVYSKSERKRVLAKAGLQEFVRHVPRPDGRKPDTTRWI